MRTNAELVMASRDRFGMAHAAFEASDRSSGWVHLLAMQMNLAAAKRGEAGEDVVKIARAAGMIE